MPAPLGEFTVEHFLANYWQKQPCLVRNAIPGFKPEIDGDDLAGLACEPLAESRLVSGHYPDHDWELRHGPFSAEDFARLPDERWTLLVQDVEKHYPPLLEFMAMFDFLPSWRLDDLMISYAATGGSVGPHVDQYDVFLFQVEGERLWQIAERYEPALVEDCPLNVLREFEAEREWVLRPGDLLYLPPDVAHHGVALDPGMTWSVGLRAPGAADLLMALGEQLALAGDEGGRYRDPDLDMNQRPGEIDRKAIRQLRTLMRGAMGEHAAFDGFAGRFLTRFRLAQEPAPPETSIDLRSLLTAAASGKRLLRNPWTRLAWIQCDAGALLFAAGECFSCSVALATCLCASTEPEPFSINLGTRDTETLAALVNGGHLLLADNPSLPGSGN
jgi:50S ribosomal protein L16 3-hydroxylase